MLEIFCTSNPNSTDRTAVFTLFSIATESTEANGVVLLYVTNWTRPSSLDILRIHWYSQYLLLLVLLYDTNPSACICTICTVMLT